jgi:hypothetical protein
LIHINVNTQRAAKPRRNQPRRPLRDIDSNMGLEKTGLNNSSDVYMIKVPE